MGSGQQGKHQRRHATRLVAVIAALALLGGCAASSPPTTDAPEPQQPVSAPASEPSDKTPDGQQSASPDASTPPQSEASAGGADVAPGDTETPDDTTPPAEPAPSGTTSPAASPSSAPGALTASAALAELAVKGRAPKTGYDRDAFKYRAVDLDRNGCDTRNDILRRDLTRVSLEPGTHDCVVETGTLADPYSGLSIAFTRGTRTSNAVQIDHVVALSDAWQKGAQSWNAGTLAAFGNDPLNLLAVDGPLNSAKGDGDAATWLPPSKSFRCQYVARQVAVKHAYGLWVTAAEKDAISRILAACPNEPLPAASTALRVDVTGDKRAPVEKPTQKPVPKPTQKPTEKPSSKPEPEAADPNYGTCKEAKRHGAGPYVQGRDPEYSFYRDRDKDGIVCE